MKAIRKGILRGFAAAIVALCLLQARPAAAEDTVVGTWKLVSWITEDVATLEQMQFYGAQPLGSLIYTDSGRMMAVVTAEGLTFPQTVAEQSKAYRSLVAYSGLYEVGRTRIVHHIDVAWNGIWVGTDQIRLYSFDSGRLILQTLPHPLPAWQNRVIRHILTWDRES